MDSILESTLLLSNGFLKAHNLVILLVFLFYLYEEESVKLEFGFINCRYTSFSQLFPLLGSGRLPPLVKVEEISQTIDSENFTVQNSVRFTGPLATTSVSTNAKFEVRSPKRVQVCCSFQKLVRLFFLFP